MKFKVGDCFVELRDLKFIDNKYHSDKAFQKERVAVANEKIFSPSPNAKMDTSIIAGSDRYHYGLQESGKNLNDDKIFLHVTHDRAIIKQVIDSTLDKALSEERVAREDRKNSIEEKIKHLQGELARINDKTEKELFLERNRIKAYEFFDLD